MNLEAISEHRSFGGKVGFYRHLSAVNNCSMRFSVFVPPQAASRKVPVLTYLSGLTCTEETLAHWLPCQDQSRDELTDE